MNIRMKFTLAALAAALLPLGGYFAISYQESKAQLEEQVKASFEEGTAIGTQRLDDWFAANKAAVKTLAKAPDMMKDPVAGKAEMLRVIKPYSWIRAAFATGADGMQTLRSDEEKPVPVGDRPYYKDAKAKGLGGTVVMSRVTNKAGFFLASPLDPVTGGDGVVALAIDLDKISKAVVSQSAMGEQSKAGSSATGEQRFIALADGKLLAHSKPGAVAAAKAGELADIAKHPLWAERPKAVGQMEMKAYDDAQGRHWVGAMKLSSLGWYVAVELPQDEVEAPLTEMRQRALIAFGVAAIFAALVAFVAGGLLARPIRVLTSVTEDIAKGKFDDARLKSIRSKDELGSLAQSIGRLANSVKFIISALADASKK